jgi:hypothetical protein
MPVIALTAAIGTPLCRSRSAAAPPGGADEGERIAAASIPTGGNSEIR